MKVLCFLGISLLFSSFLFAQSSTAVSGEYAEARSGEVYTCGCLFSSEQASGGRDAILAWDIRDGRYEGAPLAGMKAVAVVVGDGNLGLAETSRRSVLYLDSGSTDGQRQAVVELLKRHYGQVLGEVIAVHAAPVVLQNHDGQVHVAVDDIVSVSLRPTRLPQDAHQGSRQWYEPFIPVKAPELETTLYYRFWGPDFQRQWWTSEPRITAFTGDFVLSN